MENIFCFAGKSYDIPKKEQEEIGHDFGTGCLYEGEQLNLKWYDNAYQPTRDISTRIEINSIEFNDEYFFETNVKKKYDNFLKSNVIFSDEKDCAQVFGCKKIHFSYPGECVSFEKRVKEELLKIIMPISKADWQEFLCNNEMKNGMKKYFDRCFGSVKSNNLIEVDEDKFAVFNNYTKIKVKNKVARDANSTDNLEDLVQAENKKKLLEKQGYTDKEKRRFVFLNSKLHLLASLGIDEHFFEDLDLDLQRQILHLHITYGCEPFKFFNMVTSNNNIPLEKKVEFTIKVLKEVETRDLSFSIVQNIIYYEIKNDQEILRQTVNKLVSDCLGIGYCDFTQEFESNIFDFFTTGLVKANGFFRKLNPRMQMEFMKNFNEEKYRQLKILNNYYLKFLVENGLFQNYLINNPGEFFVLLQFYNRAKLYGVFLESFSAIINDCSIDFEERKEFFKTVVEKFVLYEERLKTENISLWEIICNEKNDLVSIKLIINKLVSDYLGVADCSKFLNQKYEKKDLKTILELFTTVNGDFYLSKKINLDKKNNLEEEFNFENDLNLEAFLLKSEKEKIKKYCLDIGLEIEILQYLSYEQLIELHDNFSENPQITRNETFAKLSLLLKAVYLKIDEEQRNIFDTLSIEFLNLINAHKGLQTYLVTYPDKLSVWSNFYESTHSNAIKALELFNIVMDSDNIYFYERIDFLKKVLDRFQSEEDSSQTDVPKIICDEIEINQEILKLTVYRFVADNLGVAAFNFVRGLKAENLKNILYWLTTIDTTFYKLNSNLKFVFLKSFVKGNQDVFSVLNNNEFLNLLIANEKLQDFSMIYPDKINALMEIYLSTPHFLKLEPLSRAVMFFEACKEFDWKDDIREKFCSVVDDRLLQDKDLISFLAKCQNEEQMRVVCEIYHYGGNKINGKFGINEINHFEIICKMIKEFSLDKETYNSYRMSLAKFYANAEKIGLFKNEFLYNNGAIFCLDEIFLLEVSRCPDIVDKLISGELSFDDAKNNVLSNDFLLFGWIEHTNLKFSGYKLYLVQSLFCSFQDIFASISGNERYNVFNNIYELRKFVCNLSDGFDISYENINALEEKLREVIKIPGVLSKLNVKGNNIDTVQAAIKILNNEDTQETINDFETRVNIINYCSDKFVNELYWYGGYLTSVTNTIFDLDSKNIKDELDKNLVTVEGVSSYYYKKKSSNHGDLILLKIFAQKAIYDSENLEIRLENLTFLYDQSLKFLKKNIRLNDDQNIQEQIDSLKKYFTPDLSDLDLNHINSANNLDSIKKDLRNILNKLSDYKSNCSDFKDKDKIGDLCKNIKEYLYPCILLHKVLIPKAKMMIEERNKAKTNKINLTAIPQIIDEKINSRNEREYILNKLADLNENNMRYIKDLLVENPDNIILIVRLFNIIDTTKSKTIEKQGKINISLKPMDKLYNEQNTFIKTDINNMFGLFKYETFSFLNSNPDIVEFMLGLNCINVDLLNVDILKRIKQLQEFCPVHLLIDYVRVVLNAVDYVEQDKQEVMLRLLNRSYINFVANKNVFGVLSQDPYLGIVMIYLPDKADIIFKIMQDNKAIDLLKKICLFTNDVYSIRNRLDKLFNIYELYPEMIKENMTVKELWNIDLNELRYRKQYEETLKRSIRGLTEVEQKQETFFKAIDLLCRDELNEDQEHALSTAVSSVSMEIENELFDERRKQYKSIIKKSIHGLTTLEKKQAAIENAILSCINNIERMSDKTEKKLCKTALYNATILFVDKVEQADNCFINAYSKLCKKDFSDIDENYDPNSKSFEQVHDEIKSATDSLKNKIELMPESTKKSCENILDTYEKSFLSQCVKKKNKVIDDFKIQCQKYLETNIFSQGTKTFEQICDDIKSAADSLKNKIELMPESTKNICESTLNEQVNDCFVNAFSKQYKKTFSNIYENLYVEQKTFEQLNNEIQNEADSLKNKIEIMPNENLKQSCKEKLDNAKKLLLNKIKNSNEEFENHYKNQYAMIFNANLCELETFKQRMNAISNIINFYIDEFDVMQSGIAKDLKLMAFYEVAKSFINRENGEDVNNYLIEEYKKQCEESLKASIQTKWYQRTKTYEQKRQAIASTADSLMQEINYLQSKSLKNYFANILINAKNSVVMQEAEKMRREFESSNRVEDQSR